MRFDYVFGENVQHLYPGVSIAIEHITPEIASAMLEVNISNRPTYKSTIGRAIENGEWSLNGETIVFSQDGVLLDGQNRLFACIQVKKPIDTIVVRGIASETQDTMDQGKKRTVQDYLIMAGLPNAKVLAPIGGQVYRATVYGFEKAITPSSSKTATTKEIVSFIKQNHESRLDKLVRPALNIHSENKCLRIGPVGLFLDYLLTNGADVADVRAFAEQLSGNSSPCNPVLILKKRLRSEHEKDPLSHGAGRQKLYIALVVKAWNAFITGAEISTLRFSPGGAKPEAFPKIIVRCD